MDESEYLFSLPPSHYLRYSIRIQTSHPALPLFHKSSYVCRSVVSDEFRPASEDHHAAQPAIPASKIRVNSCYSWFKILPPPTTIAWGIALYATAPVFPFRVLCVFGGQSSSSP